MELSKTFIFEILVPVRFDSTIDINRMKDEKHPALHTPGIKVQKDLSRESRYTGPRRGRRKQPNCFLSGAGGNRTRL